MKKLSLLVLCVFVLSCAPVQAKTGDVVGHVYSSDIVAYIDDMPIPSYNIGGTTCVSENDLAKYGFELYWNADERVLLIGCGEKPTTAPAVTIEKETPGKIVGDIYETDIMTYIHILYDFIPIQSYNIGGETMIPLEELRQDSNTFYGYPNREIGYSNYGFKIVWDAKNRTIKVNTLRKGCSVTTKYGTYPIVDTCRFYDRGSDTIVLTDKDIEYSNLNEVFKSSSITPSWENNMLTLNDVTKKSLIFYGGGSHTDASFTLLPMIEVPVSINDNGVTKKFMIHLIVSDGKFYTNPEEWKPYLVS